MLVYQRVALALLSDLLSVAHKVLHLNVQGKLILARRTTNLVFAR